MTIVADEDDLGDVPAPPVPEFDRDAQYALSSPGLSKEDREEIRREARALGLSREAVGNWICRKVAQAVGGPHGFTGYDDHGNAIDPQYVVEARKYITSLAGSKSQKGRNVVIEAWRQRCQQLHDSGWSWKKVMGTCEDAVIKLAARESGGAALPVPAPFKDLPPIFGKKKRSTPSAKSLRQNLFGSSSLRLKKPTWADN
jgi:hypothetical protein